ncbi:TRAK1 isoform 13 [Pongo abelii]|uniref:TRAK1 isoform 13 n=1 Tax=Pongo abelii TaxID=9601 RepID=A0A2J8WXW0_PONAB|nr:TRAK1 isoform 13 [Pongo abelii]
MQKFIEADYYELDWYYEECSDALPQLSLLALRDPDLSSFKSKGK